MKARILRLEEASRIRQEQERQLPPDILYPERLESAVMQALGDDLEGPEDWAGRIYPCHHCRAWKNTTCGRGYDLRPWPGVLKDCLDYEYSGAGEPDASCLHLV